MSSRPRAPAAVVRAPVAGILVHPPGEKGDSAGQPLHVGMSLTKGQLIGAIAHPGGLAVTFQLSEADANRVHTGQRVAVTGPGFEGVDLSGTIASVAGEATPASGGDGAVTFAASARLDPLTPAQAAIVRIGMSASVSIDLYRNPAALVAPPPAIQGDAPDTYVMVKVAGGGGASTGSRAHRPRRARWRGDSVGTEAGRRRGLDGFGRRLRWRHRLIVCYGGGF